MMPATKIIQLTPLPGIAGFCEQFRIRAQDRLRPYATGRHIQLFRGRSWEFQDYAPYTPGDDIRYVDWRASYRNGRKDEWLIRRFQAEESLNIIVSIDTRESMYLPTVLPKIQMAAWAAEAIARIALRSDDRIYFHRLFGVPCALPFYQRSNAILRLFPTLKKLVETSAPENAGMNLKQLSGGFFTNAALVIFSDFYFTDQSANKNNMAGFIRTAEQGWRWVILVNLNSWPFEAWQLTGERASLTRRVFGPGLNEAVECDTGTETLKIVEQNIHTCQRNFLDSIKRLDFDLNWHWESGPGTDPLHFFEKCFTVKPSQSANPQNSFYQMFIRQR
jgi:hypothetical protein